MSAGKGERRKRREGSHSDGFWGWFSGDWGGTIAPDTGMLIVLVILVIAGVAVLVYFVAIVVVNFLSLGEVHRASVYCRKVRRYAIDEPKGCYLARELMHMRVYFTLLLFFFTTEEALRYFLHTGPATLEIWIFRIACLGIFFVILGIFLVRLGRWMNFKATARYLDSTTQIRKHEEVQTGIYGKASGSK